MKAELNLPVENMLKLYLDLERILDEVAPEKLYQKDFISGLNEAENELQNGNFSKVESFEDFVS